LTTFNLKRVISPDSVAVIGASVKKGSVGNTIMENMVEGGYKGDIFPVNPRYDTVMGKKTCSDVRELPKDIDMAVIATPITSVPKILEACSKKKIGGAVIISAGYQSSGYLVENILAQIMEISQRTKIRVIGPDSVGIVNTSIGLTANIMHRIPLKGKIAFLSHNGAVCTSVLDMAMRENVGFSHVISFGSMPDVCFADMIDFLGSAYEVESIVMYVERIKNIRNFMSAARAVSRIKPIIALKASRSLSGFQISEDEMYDAAFKRAGILRVKEFEELFDCAEFLAKQKRPTGSRLAIVSNAGGMGVMAKDALAGHGIKPAQLSEDTIKAIENVLGNNWSRTNPIDLIRILSNSQYLETVKICMNAAEIDGILLLSSPLGTYDSVPLARQLTSLLKTSLCPVFTSWMGGLDAEYINEIFNSAGIVTYETPERATRAFMNLYQYGKNIEILQEIPYRTDKRLEINRSRAAQIIEQGFSFEKGKLPGHLAKELVSTYGIPVSSNNQTQKSDYELTISAVRNNEFGPVIRFGMGGVMKDVFNDVSIALPPLNRLLARSVIEETQISKVFSGYKNIKKLDLALLEEILIRLSRLITDFPEIKSLDINPVLVKDGQMVAADGQVIVERINLKSQAHLVISPYPFWQETTFTVRDDENIFVRPVRPTDAGQMFDLFDELSPETVYLRFFSPLKKISKSMVIKFTQIDYDREIALVAFSGSKKNRKIVGVARIISDPEGKKAEFAIVLADKWQKKGIGRKLLEHALFCAKRYGLAQVMGSVITSNAPMIKLGETLGFHLERDPDSSEYRLTIDLDTIS
jgi:acetyltransferase